MKIAGVIVLYHPNDDVIKNIASYINDIDILYAIDNSDVKNDKIVNEIKKYSKIQYIDNGGNQGIANALNVGAKMAMKENYAWLLTMDQDSCAKEDMLPILKKYIQEHDMKQIGIITAYQKNEIDKNSYFLKEITQVVETKTSGNLLNMKAYRKVGKFKEKLFIDIVDYEYCLRLNHNGYHVLVNNNAILYHKLGQLKIKDNGILYSHSCVRVYYYVRNWLWVKNKYKNIFPEWIKNTEDMIQRDCIKYLMYEKNKFRYARYMVKGYIDYKRNKLGKYGEK